jgi:hypothetical protein
LIICTLRFSADSQRTFAFKGFRLFQQPLAMR